VARSGPPDPGEEDGDLIWPLASSHPGRTGMLRALGNAIVPQLAAVFIRAFMACREVR
jgi:hypothetical protein